MNIYGYIFMMHLNNTSKISKKINVYNLKKLL